MSESHIQNQNTKGEEEEEESGGQSSFEPTATSSVPAAKSPPNKALIDKFFTACYTRNIPDIASCIEKGIDANTFNSDYGVTPFHLLAERNDYVLGYHLLTTTHINMELKNSHGYTALHMACLVNCKRFVMVMLQNGANVNIRDRFGKTPLHIAVEKEYYGIVVKLLKGGALVNAIDCFENTPLSISINTVNNMLIAKTLFQYGINMNVENSRSLHIFFETILHCHSINQIDFVMLLLDNGININMQETSSGRNCLHFVAITGYLDLAVVLVERGAKWNVPDARHRTPSKAAVEHGNEILADYFRKGYRPPNLLTSLPLIYLWTNKLKAKLEARRAAELEKAEAELHK